MWGKGLVIGSVAGCWGGSWRVLFVYNVRGGPLLQVGYTARCWRWALVIGGLLLEVGSCQRWALARGGPLLVVDPWVLVRGGLCPC